MTPTSFTRTVALLLVSLLLSQNLPAATPSTNLPDLGDESAAVLSPQDERRLGEDFMRQIRSQLDIVDDPELNEYLQSLGRRLTTGAGLPTEFYFFLINNPAINAFAVPGGFVGIHTGLILAARNEAELAAVLAHETAHITQRHIPRMIADNQRLSGPAMAAILAGILIAASGQQAGQAAVALATAGMAQHELNFTRSFEQEADRVGMGILDKAGYDVRAMASFFERMESLTRLYEDQNLPEFLRTHPVTAKRIAESRDHAEGFAAKRNPNDAGFRHMQARLRALNDKPEEAQKFFRAALDQADNPNRSADRYGLALALLAGKQVDAARRENGVLLGERPDFLLYQILRADIEIAGGNTRQGLDVYAAAARRFPDSRAVVRRYASAQLKTGHAEEAWKLLDKAVRSNPAEPALYKQLATAAGESGHRMEAHRAFGEYYYLTGQPRAAIEQLDLATRYAGNNFYYVSGLEARIREIREEFTELLKRDASHPPGKKEN
jgi:predicted Zn-dependent protease